jgi:hypothetical protein
MKYFLLSFLIIIGFSCAQIKKQNNLDITCEVLKNGDTSCSFENNSNIVYADYCIQLILKRKDEKFMSTNNPLCFQKLNPKETFNIKILNNFLDTPENFCSINNSSKFSDGCSLEKISVKQEILL